jgi:hypothetical protein
MMLDCWLARHCGQTIPELVLNPPLPIGRQSLPAIHENCECALNAYLLLEIKQVPFRKLLRDRHKLLTPAVVARPRSMRMAER